jgi:hypothetical protein
MRHIAGAEAVRQAQSVALPNAMANAPLKAKRDPRNAAPLRSTWAEADGDHFSFVNESPRRLLLRRDGVEGLGASRSFALTTCVRVKETGRYARTLCD